MIPIDEMIEFIIWLQEYEPEALSKYAYDEDKGREAYTELYNIFKK